MIREHDLVLQVLAAQEDARAADELVRQYLPFIQSETAKYLRRPPVEGQDEELGIAMFAFHEAVLDYEPGRGTFLPLAARVIRSRLIDHHRREARHGQVLSLHRHVGDGADGPTLLETLEDEYNELEVRSERALARSEITHFAQQLSAFDLKLTDVAENCPRQARTLAACHRVLAFAKSHPQLLKQLEQTGKLPLAALAEGSGVERKTLERHRKYLVAILLAYTNGFEIIRGHLRQMQPGKGGR